jgi:hypothetical protein
MLNQSIWPTWQSSKYCIPWRSINNQRTLHTDLVGCHEINRDVDACCSCMYVYAYVCMYVFVCASLCKHVFVVICWVLRWDVTTKLFFCECVCIYVCIIHLMSNTHVFTYIDMWICGNILYILTAEFWRLSIYTTCWQLLIYQYITTYGLPYLCNYYNILTPVNIYNTCNILTAVKIYNINI